MKKEIAEQIQKEIADVIDALRVQGYLINWASYAVAKAKDPSIAEMVVNDISDLYEINQPLIHKLDGVYALIEEEGGEEQ